MNARRKLMVNIKRIRSVKGVNRLFWGSQSEKIIEIRSFELWAYCKQCGKLFIGMDELVRHNYFNNSNNFICMYCEEER